MRVLSEFFTRVAERYLPDAFVFVFLLSALTFILGMTQGYGPAAVAGAGPALLVATLAAFGAGWAFTGLVNLQVVTTWHDAPAAATGVTQSGIFLGGTAGPLAFGWVAEHASYALAWWGAALLLAATAGLVVLARRELPAPVAQDVA